jgi:cysteine desulfurase family protein (TIGR01976 family)
VEAVSERLSRGHFEKGARYRSSEEVDELVSRARESLGAFLNAFAPDEVLMGADASSLIRRLSRSLGEQLASGDEVVVSELDHEANIAPWLELEKRGVTLKFWSVDNDGAQLDIEKLDEVLTERTRLVALTKASNAVGTIVDLIPVAERVHAREGYLFVDAVHFAQHGSLDVRFLGCDFLVCSGHKAFGPHVGFLWGRREALDSLAPVTETFNYEAIAGMNATVGYVEELGRRSRHLHLPPEEDIGRRGDLRRGMQAIRHYERSLSTHLLSRLEELPEVKVYGVRDPDRAALRTPAFCINVAGLDPADVSRKLAGEKFLVRDGDFDSPRLFQALRLSESGAVRVSFAHYNSYEEVDRFVEVLRKISRGS